MARRPLPILVLTAAPQDTELVVEALNAGAIDFVQKPTALATDDLRVIRDQLVEKVQTAARAPVDHLLAPPSAIATPLTTPTVVRDSASRAQVVVLGISTGGPQALRQMLPLLPADFPVPFGIVLHMPVGYTALYAEKLNEICHVEVREAREGDVLRPGLVLIAQAGRHLQFRREANGSVTAQLTLQPLEKTHRPSVDVLFRSAAEVYGGQVLAVVMTGMGEDGKEGAAWVKAQGGTVLTEDEKSCIIYGMPRSVVEAGLSDAPIPLSEMAQAITARI
jgi:two-component system chemotaxis response regulator CheB